MDSKISKQVKQEYMTKAVLMLVFLTGFALFAYWMANREPGLPDFQLGWLDLVLLGLATYRLGRLIAYDVVMEPVRRPFARTVPDGTGAGESVEPRGVGTRRAIGQLISCPICAGTWIAAILVFGLYLIPVPARIFLWMSATIGAAELLNSLTEVLCWSGQHARTMAGAQELARKAAAEERRTTVHQRVEETSLNGREN